MTSVTVFAECVKATAAVAVCVRIFRTVREWFRPLLALAYAPLGGHAKRADYIAIASSLSPPK